MPKKPPVFRPRGSAERSQSRERERQRELDAHRESPSKRGYNTRWQKYRVAFLGRNPVCVRCAEWGLAIPATVVDHIVPHRGDSAVFWDKTNHQALCKPCHDRKTATEDGGFGRRKETR